MKLLTAPEGGAPEPVVTEKSLLQSIDALKKGSGPFAIDAERASGFRYSARAYLIQIYRNGGGLHLIDPIPLAHSSLIEQLNSLIRSDEVIIHASSQDLPCLREFGLDPSRLFDTELGARIAGFPKVGLATLCEELLEISLAKEHSAADWSTRPLPQEWLDYAALDVLVLIDLREKIAASLEGNGKLNYANEEFSAALKVPLLRERKDPWRKTSGIHLLKFRRDLAIVRQLWIKRDEIASAIDLAPGRLLSDSIIIEVATKKPVTKNEFLDLPSVKMRIKRDPLRERIDLWWSEIEKSYEIPEKDWPEARARGEGLPAPRIWRDKFPLAHARLTHARAILAEISQSLNIPVENLLTPDYLRRLIFDDGRERAITLDAKLIASVKARLIEFGARNWQIELLHEKLALCLTQVEPLIAAPVSPAAE